MRVLIADDDKRCAEFMSALVEAAGHEVVAVETGGGLAVMQSYARHMPDCLLLDVMMPKFNGFTVAQQVRSRTPGAHIIMMSGLVREDYPAARHCHPDAWLTKPIAFEDLCAALSRAADRIAA
jgi:DNA-binding response OmpR family regulator